MTTGKRRRDETPRPSNSPRRPPPRNAAIVTRNSNPVMLHRSRKSCSLLDWGPFSCGLGRCDGDDDVVPLNFLADGQRSINASLQALIFFPPTVDTGRDSFVCSFTNRSIELVVIIPSAIRCESKNNPSIARFSSAPCRPLGPPAVNNFFIFVWLLL